MSKKEKIINDLISREYGHLSLQLLLAELVYETQKFNRSDLKKRYSSLLQIVLGSPKKSASFQGNVDDERLLIEAGMLVQGFKMTASGACELVARRQVIDGYRSFPNPVKLDLTEDQAKEIEKIKRRLYRKLKQDPKKYAKKYMATYIAEIEGQQAIGDDLHFTISLISGWLKHCYGSRDKFEKID